MHKRPVSVLVVIHTADLHVLLLERASHAGYWQSVTGSQEGSESLVETAVRELHEETGIRAESAALRDWKLTNTFEIFTEWRHRYAPEVSHNTEHVFSLELPAIVPVSIAPYVSIIRESSASEALPGTKVLPITLSHLPFTYQDVNFRGY